MGHEICTDCKFFLFKGFLERDFIDIDQKNYRDTWSNQNTD